MKPGSFQHYNLGSQELNVCVGHLWGHLWDILHCWHVLLTSAAKVPTHTGRKTNQSNKADCILEMPDRQKVRGTEITDRRWRGRHIKGSVDKENENGQMDRLYVSVIVREQGIHRQRAWKRNRRRTCVRKLAQMQQRVAIAGFWSHFFFFYLCAFSLKGWCSTESTNTESLSAYARTHTYTRHACMRSHAWFTRQSWESLLPSLQQIVAMPHCLPCCRPRRWPRKYHETPEHQDWVSSGLEDSQLQLSSNMLLRCSRFYYSSCGWNTADD